MLAIRACKSESVLCLRVVIRLPGVWQSLTIA